MRIDIYKPAELTKREYEIKINKLEEDLTNIPDMFPDKIKDAKRQLKVLRRAYWLKYG